MEFTNLVRQTIYMETVATGRVPAIAEIAVQMGMHEDDVRSACRDLADAHVVVFRPDGRELWAAPPFSAVPSAFKVHAGSRSWFAPCAWDAFGIPAALNTDADIDARCAWTGDPLPAGVRRKEVYGNGVIHLEVPARHFWDDIVYT
jgi:alkylmercury lyase-like protein